MEKTDMFYLKDVSYKDIIQLKELKIGEGIVTCIVGQSGAGKTSLLRLLNRMNNLNGGQIFYKGELLETIEPVAHRRKVMMLSQTPLIFPGSIEANLQIGLDFSEKTSVTKEEFKRVLHIVMLDKRLDDDAEKLSGGEKQRLAMSRMLLLKPEVYLLDEPTSALDEESEMIVMNRFIEEAGSNQGTIIMITHSKMLAERYADEIITLQKQKQ
ncbi:ATP-binding cassette domain-containing protein [Bacillus sp. CECT 9360]|uniref:ABC transporter ATP-binding protein n=1 Tax=Bacillus sp. CECT 9360 TaxID=2845821 RepID=UPI001E62B706|nr:ATP-binding cassette domain-containing protein [Bacillus sp. CECT 9360]CAH0345884.1 Phosphate import ATP-binding protein PstB 2 [Bacillus sp. CECT 9360]